MSSARPGRGAIRLRILVQSIAVVALFAVANAVAFEHFFRADFSRSQKFALAQQTKRVIRELKKPVDVTVIASASFASPVMQILPDIRSLLAELVFSGRDLIRVSYVDPTRDLSGMRELQGRYKFTNADGLVIVEYDGRSRLINFGELADFDFRPLAQNEAPILLAFRGEQVFTSTLIGLIRPEEQTVYFLAGNGGPALAGGQLSTLADYLQKQNLRVAPLSLSDTESIPADAGVLVIAGAKYDLGEREAAVLRAWWKARGRFLVLLDPDADTPRLREFVTSAGIVPQNDRVLRTVKLPFATGILRDVTGEVLPTTEMTRRLAGVTVLFPGATQSLRLENEKAAAERIQLRPLIAPAEEFWGETDYAPNTPGGVRYDDGRDHGQPLTIAAMADRGGVADDRVEIQTARMIVVGSSQFVLDAAIKPSSLDFLLGSVNTLLDRARLAGVAPKTISHFNLELSQSQLGLLALFSLVVIPGCAGLLGVLTWWRRRA